MKVHELLSLKFRPVYTLTSDQTVDDAINLMSAKAAGALIVTEGKRPVGVFAERDVFRAHIKDKTASFADIRLKDALIYKLFAAKPEDEISSVMSMMIQADIKHVPVMKGTKVLGMLTLDDLIEHQIGILTEELQHLREYIEDLHHAGQD